MRIDGKKLQLELLKNLKKEIEILKQKGITPGIGIVTLGDEETWEAYVGQKIKLAKELGITVKLINLRPKTTEEVIQTITGLNSDKTISGLIVQRPFPIHIDTKRIIQSVSKDKDIDGFRDDSLFDVPVFLAVMHLIRHAVDLPGETKLQNRLSNQSIVVVGKGETAGKPTIDGLKRMKIIPSIIDSKTGDKEQIFEKADLIVSATGKENSIPISILKKNCILIGVGLHRNTGQLRGDFDENEAELRGLTYSPSPGGVGPLNLYYLFKNLVIATKKRI